MSTQPANKISKILETILDISNSTELDFHVKIQSILDAVLNFLTSKTGSIMIVKDEELEVVAASNPELIGVRQAIDGRGPAAWVVKNKQPLYSNEKTGSTDNTLEYHSNRYEKEAFIITPIKTGGDISGVISITEKIGPDRFSSEERDLLMSISGYIIGTLQSLRMSESLKRSKDALKEKNDRLKKLEKVQKDLFNMMIHDLKGPISEIVANLDILSYKASAENMEFVEAAQTGCDTLLGMTSNLLDITRLEVGALQLIKERITPDELLNEAVSRLYSIAKIHDVEIIMELPDERDKHFLDCDRGVILRVLQNLLINAIQHSPSGDKVKAGYTYIPSYGYELFVKDNGPGIPDNFKKSIFDKYTQLARKNDGRIYSTGLGLTFCKLAVEAHDGKIFIDDQTGNGCCFKFNI